MPPELPAAPAAEDPTAPPPALVLPPLEAPAAPPNDVAPALLAAPPLPPFGLALPAAPVPVPALELLEAPPEVAGAPALACGACPAVPAVDAPSPPLLSLFVAQAPKANAETHSVAGQKPPPSDVTELRVAPARRARAAKRTSRVIQSNCRLPARSFSSFFQRHSEPSAHAFRVGSSARALSGVADPARTIGGERARGTARLDWLTSPARGAVRAPGAFGRAR